MKWTDRAERARRKREQADRHGEFCERADRHDITRCIDHDAEARLRDAGEPYAKRDFGGLWYVIAPSDDGEMPFIHGEAHHTRESAFAEYIADRLMGNA